MKISSARRIGGRGTRRFRKMMIGFCMMLLLLYVMCGFVIILMLLNCLELFLFLGVKL